MMHYSCHEWQRRSTSPITVPPRAVSMRRQWALGGVLALALVGVAGKLAYWQIAQHTDLAGRATAQHMQDLVLPSGRGTIYDRNGTVLALTVTGSAVVLDPLQARQFASTHPGALDQMAGKLAALTGTTSANVRAQLMLPTGYHVLVGTDGAVIHLSQDAGEQISQMSALGALPGVTLQPQAWRVTPDGTLAGQVLGFVRTTDGVGQYGVEQQDDALLAGAPGHLFTAVDAQDSPIASVPQRATPATPGADITLTLDMNIQAMAEQGLHAALAQTGATGGTVIVEDPHTGAILALANAPGFDPNNYATTALATFQDPAVAAVYDPGSTMKAITMAAGIDTGAITPATTIDDPGYFTVDGQTLYNWQQLAWGTESMTQVLAHSANVGAAWVAVDAVGHDRFYRYLHAFGFGAPTHIALPGEAAGLLPPTESNQALSDLDLAENAFGESIGVTPLQMVMAYGALANSGTLMQPMIVAGVTHGGTTQTMQPTTTRRVVSQRTAATVTQMLVDSGRQGDAQTGLIQGYTVAAKTGTSTPDPAHPSQTYASVLGYAPANQPQFVVLVKLDHPQSSIYGGEAAGPLWRALVRQLMAYAHIPTQEGN